MTNPKKEPTRKEWTPEEVENLIKFVGNLVEKYIVYKRDERTSSSKYLEIASIHNRKLTMVLGIILFSIIGVMSILTYLNRVSGDALLFLVGTVTGYLILFIQKLVFGQRPPQPTSDDVEV